MSDDLNAMVRAESALVRKIGTAARAGDEGRGIAAFTDLIVKLASGFPVLGALAGEVTRYAVAKSAWGGMQAELKKLEAEQSDEELSMFIAHAVTQSLGHALRALLEGQQRILDSLGNLEDAFEAVQLATRQALHIDHMTVGGPGATGIRGMPQEGEVSVNTVVVEAGGVGLDFTKQ